MSSNVHHILLADDNAALVRSLQIALRHDGHLVGTASNGHEALAYIRSHCVDAVVLDVFMPEMDGFETLRSIREEFPQLKVIMVSGGGIAVQSPLYLGMTVKLGANAVLQKPFTARQIIEKLRA